MIETDAAGEAAAEAARPAGDGWRRRDAIWQYYAGFGLARAATVAVLPIVAHTVGPAEFGYFEAAFAVLLAAMIPGDPGMGAAVVRFGGPRDEEAGPTFRTAVGVQLWASLLAFALFAGPMLLVASPAASAALVLSVLLVFTVVEGVGVVGAGIVRVREQHRAYLVLGASRLAVAVAAGAFGAAVADATGALFGVALASIGFAVVAARAWLANRARAVGAGLRPGLLRYGLPLISTSVMIWALSLSDRLFLRIWETPEELGRYAASYRLGGIVAIFVAGPLALAWVPVARRAASRAELDALCLRWAVYLTVVALGVGALVVAASERLVPVVFGSGFEADAFVVAAVVVSGWLFGLYFLIATDVLISATTVVLAWISVVVVAVNLAACAVLVSGWGTRGAAVATLVSYLCLCVATGLAVTRVSAFPGWLLRPELAVVFAVFVGLVALALVVPPAALAVLGLAPAILLLRRGRPGRV